MTVFDYYRRQQRRAEAVRQLSDSGGRQQREQRKEPSLASFPFVKKDAVEWLCRSPRPPVKINPTIQ